MSVNPTIKANDVVAYIGQVLNIDISDRLVFMDILDELKNIEDLAAFRLFIKTRFNYERFRYLTGFQKFTAIMNEYKSENKPKLNQDQLAKVDDFSSKLFSKTCYVFDEVNFEIQNGKSLLHFNMEKSFTEKEMQVLNQIGPKQQLLNLATHGKAKLENEIRKVVHSLTLVKTYPQLAYKGDTEAKSLLEALGRGK
jgi:hypothetical protein